jgi:hypothetical protein
MDNVCDNAPTEPSLLYLIRRQGKHRKYFDHNFDNYVCHRHGGGDLHIYLKTQEEIAQAFKQFNKSVVTRGDPTGSLA